MAWKKSVCSVDMYSPDWVCPHLSIWTQHNMKKCKISLETKTISSLIPFFPAIMKFNSTKRKKNWKWTSTCHHLKNPRYFQTHSITRKFFPLHYLTLINVSITSLFFLNNNLFNFSATKMSIFYLFIICNIITPESHSSSQVNIGF